MKAARVIAILVSLIGWGYAWVVFRRVRSEFLVTHASPPVWLLVLMGLASTMLIATAVVAGMRTPSWPWVAIAAGLVFIGMVVLGQRSVMQNAVDFAEGDTTVTFIDASRASIRERSLPGAAVIAGVSTGLVLSGLTGLITRRRVALE